MKPTERDILEKLVSAYPKCFSRDETARRPLQVGIHRILITDMVAHGLSPAELRAALSEYCQSPGYLAAVVAGATRVDLAGEPAGTVNGKRMSLADLRATAKARQTVLRHE